MGAKGRQLLRMWRLYARMDWRFMTQDAFGAVVMTVSELIVALSALAGTALLAVRFGGVGVLSSEEVLVFLAFHLLSEGLEHMLLGGYNINSISRRIGRGQVDHMLIQPVPLWMQLCTEGFLPFSGCQQLLCGMVALCLFAPRAGVAITPAWLALLAVLAFTRLAIHVAVGYLAGSAAFYSPVGCEEITDVVYSLCGTVARYPLSGMPAAMVNVLLTVLPLGLFSYLPALILLGRVDAIITAWPVLVALALCALAKHVFMKGMKHYVQVGSARYKGMGHRS